MKLRPKAGAGLCGLLALGAMLALPLRAWAGCEKDTDCKGDRICIQGSCQANASEPAPNQPLPSPPEPLSADSRSARGSRFRAVFQYAPAVGGSGGLGQVVHAAGMDLSWAMGAGARYHLAVSYVSEAQGPPSGFRVEPLRFSWAFPVYRSGSIQLDLEPFVSLAEISDFFAYYAPALEGQLPHQNSLAFGAGIGLQIAVSVGRFRGFVQPLGLDIVYNVENFPPAAGQLPNQILVQMAYEPGVGVGMDF